MRGAQRGSGSCRPCRATIRLNPAAQPYTPASSTTTEGVPLSASNWYTIEEQASGEAAHGAAGWHDTTDYLIRIVVWDTYHEEGWDRLQIEVNDRVPIPDTVKAHAAGYGEAFFTAQSIWDYWSNYRQNEWSESGGVPSPGLIQFIEKQVAYVRQRVAQRSGSSKYWRLMGLVMSQFDGLVEGYLQNMRAPHQNMTWQELYMLQSVGDLYELNVLFPPVNATQQQQQLQRQEGEAVGVVSPARRYTPGHGIVGPEGYGELLECSALIKVDMESWEREQQRHHEQPQHEHEQQQQQQQVTGRHQFMHRRGLRAAWSAAGGTEGMEAWAESTERGGMQDSMEPAPGRHTIHSAGELDRHNKRKRGDVDFWAGHNTWRPYYAMRRTWKVYTFPWVETGPLVVSSSPGLLFSKDDWYTTDRFVIMETTNGIYNKTLYDAIQPSCSLMWQRVMVANFGATSGREWAQLFAKGNSGTYNNQWMVFDVDALQKGWAHDVLWVLEQIPGWVEKADVTAVLQNQGFWASYNVPYFPIIYNLTGYPVDKDMWHTCARARIFTRDAPEVSSISQLKRLLRYNRYQSDELSEGKPNNAIAARYDLVPLKGHRANWTRRPFGAVDAKLVSAHTFRERTTEVICGPTTDDQEPFRWSSSGFKVTAHVGTANEFEFDWQQYRVEAYDHKQEDDGDQSHR